MKLDERGLIPVVVQDHLTGEVRMLAYASEASIERTTATGRATFWSRSRQELWEKGKTSGNGLAVRDVTPDCDADALLWSCEPEGPTCHTGSASCFDVRQTAMARLEARIEARRTSTADASYTKTLFEAGATKIGAKLREEADELARAIAGEDRERVASEAADVVYHLAVGLASRGVRWRDVLGELERRSGVPGHVERASRK
jgi:phosphoribosyl-AMP cyclohydrolase / phosphoribosyl-ATP pyrophosphohydrolase